MKNAFLDYGCLSLVISHLLLVPQTQKNRQLSSRTFWIPPHRLLKIIQAWFFLLIFSLKEQVQVQQCDLQISRSTGNLILWRNDTCDKEQHFFHIRKAQLFYRLSSHKSFINTLFSLFSPKAQEFNKLLSAYNFFVNSFICSLLQIQALY